MVGRRKLRYFSEIYCFCIMLWMQSEFLNLSLKFDYFQIKMAKGKHAPSKGAVREDKIIHPKSRKAAKMHYKEQRKLKISTKHTIGGQRLQILGEKLLWFHDNMHSVLSDESKKTLNSREILDLIQAYIERFEDELEQINLKNSIGQFKKRNQHQSRIDSIELTKKNDNEQFNGCGIEIPDLTDPENFKKFKDWNGELRFVQNFKLKRVTRTRTFLESNLDTNEEMVTE